MLSAKSDARDNTDNFSSKVQFVKKSKITIEEKFNIYNKQNKNMLIRSVATNFFLGSQNKDGTLIQSKFNKNLNFSIFKYDTKESKNKNIVPMIFNKIYKKYEQKEWNVVDKLSNLQNISVNVDDFGTQYLWGTHKNNIYNRKPGSKFLKESLVRNWRQTEGSASYVHVMTDNKKINIYGVLTHLTIYGMLMLKIIYPNFQIHCSGQRLKEKLRK